MPIAIKKQIKAVILLKVPLVGYTSSLLLAFTLLPQNAPEYNRGALLTLLGCLILHNYFLSALRKTNRFLTQFGVFGNFQVFLLISLAMKSGHLAAAFKAYNIRNSEQNVCPAHKTIIFGSRKEANLRGLIYE